MSEAIAEDILFRERESEDISSKTGAVMYVATRTGYSKLVQSLSIFKNKRTGMVFATEFSFQVTLTTKNELVL
jgi:hypothetical protein